LWYTTRIYDTFIGYRSFHMLLSIKQYSKQEDMPIYGGMFPSDMGLMPGNGIYTKPPGSLMIQPPSQPPTGHPHLE
jgi:hypothetical protein